MRFLNYKDIDFSFENIVFCITTEPDFEMERKILLDFKNLKIEERFVIVEGYHCSCYDFYDINWEATSYKYEELLSLSYSEHYRDDEFWIQVRKHINE